jgi:hypothetical protein
MAADPTRSADFVPGETLAAARDAVLTRHDTVPDASPPPQRFARGWLLIAIGAWVLVVASFGDGIEAFHHTPPEQPYTPPAGLEEASRRYGLWLAQGQVKAFLERVHRPPSFLAEAGIHDPILEYVVTGEAAWELRAGPDLSATERTPMAAILGTSVSELRAAR